MSQEDYQKKVYDAKMKKIVLDIESGKIDVSTLSSQELAEIEKYLKEKNDR